MPLIESFGFDFIGGGSSAPSETPTNVVAIIWDGAEFYGEYDRGVHYYDADLQEDGVDEVFTATPSAYGIQDFPDGLGIAELTNSGDQKLLIINDSITTENPIDFPKGTYILIYLARAVTIEVNGTADPVITITAYPFRIL